MALIEENPVHFIIENQAQGKESITQEERIVPEESARRWPRPKSAKKPSCNINDGSQSA